MPSRGNTQQQDTTQLLIFKKIIYQFSGNIQKEKGVSEIQPQRNSTVTGNNNSEIWHNRAGVMEEEIRDVKDVYFTTKDLRDNR